MLKTSVQESSMKIKCHLLSVELHMLYAEEGILVTHSGSYTTSFRVSNKTTNLSFLLNLMFTL